MSYYGLSGIQRQLLLVVYAHGRKATNGGKSIARLAGCNELSWWRALAKFKAQQLLAVEPTVRGRVSTYTLTTAGREHVNMLLSGWNGVRYHALVRSTRASLAASAKHKKHTKQQVTSVCNILAGTRLTSVRKLTVRISTPSRKARGWGASAHSRTTARSKRR